MFILVKKTKPQPFAITMRFGAEQIEGPIELPGNSSTTTYLVRVSHVREMKLFVHVYRYVGKRFRVP